MFYLSPLPADSPHHPLIPCLIFFFPPLSSPSSPSRFFLWLGDEVDLRLRDKTTARAAAQGSGELCPLARGKQRPAVAARDRGGAAPAGPWRRGAAAEQRRAAAARGRGGAALGGALFSFFFFNDSGIEIEIM